MIDPIQDILSNELLPEELQAQLQAEQEKIIERLESFGRALSSKRDDAVSGRVSSGIEQEWVEDEEAYQGIDDANRNSSNSKPTSHTGGSSIVTTRSKDVRSTVFLNITRPYVDAAAAKVADMLLPTDDRNWAIKPTPLPELEMIKNSEEPAILPGPDGAPVADGSTIKDKVAELYSDASKKSEAAQKRIDDWLIECQYHAEVRKVIEDCSRLGTGILKGPFPGRTRSKVIHREPGITAIEIIEKIVPKSKRIDPWNFYPDPACGENIHDGAYCWEKDNITAKQLKDLIGTPGYVRSQIEKVLEEGPGKKYESSRTEKAGDKERFEIWYYHGVVDKEDMEAAGVKITQSDMVNAMCVMVNDRVIKAAINPLDSGEFPYDLMPWQRRTDSPFGTGVSRQVRTPQRMLNAGARNMMDNAGLSAGPQLIIRRGSVEPADGIWQITPRKMWYVNDDADVRGVADAFAAINIPTLQGELMNIIQFAQKMAEDVTGLPMLLQGQQGSAPETVGGMSMLNNNASTVMRRIARTFDDYITEPHIRRYYEWLLLYGENEDEKGDYIIDARGSTALVEMDIYNQSVMEMGQLVQNEAFGIDPKRWFAELLKGKKMDPKKFQYSEDEMKKIEEAQSQQPPDPRIEAAQIRADAEVKKAEAQSQADQVSSEFKSQMAEQDHTAKMAALQLEREIKMLELANAQHISLEKIKAQLADTSIRERNKRDMARAEMTIKQETGSGI